MYEIQVDVTSNDARLAGQALSTLFMLTTEKMVTSPAAASNQPPRFDSLGATNNFSFNATGTMPHIIELGTVSDSQGDSFSFEFKFE